MASNPQPTYPQEPGEVRFGGSVDPTTSGPLPRLRCAIVTPEKAFLDERADFVVLPMYDGELGVLPGHTPLIGRLGYGELRISGPGGAVRRLFVDGGFAQVRADVVTVLTGRARKVEEITPDLASEALAAAEALPAESEHQREARNRALERAHAMQRLVGRGGPSGPTMRAQIDSPPV